MENKVVRTLKKNWKCGLIGAIVGLAYSFIVKKGYGIVFNLPTIFYTNCSGTVATNCGYQRMLYTNLIYGSILGFLIGAFIQSLLWRNKK